MFEPGSTSISTTTFPRLHETKARVSSALRRLCVRVVAELARDPEGERGSGMGAHLVEDCGYSSKFVR